MRVLIVYATHEGQTAKIAHEMAGSLRSKGHRVDAVRVHDAPEPDGYELVIVGSPIHLGKHDAVIADWVKRHADRVKSAHGAFFSVSLASASRDPAERDEARRLAVDFLSELDWMPEFVGCFAGALTYSQYGLLKRWVMRRIAAKEGGDTDTDHDYEYTDWTSVIEFAEQAVAVAA